MRDERSKCEAKTRWHGSIPGAVTGHEIVFEQYEGGACFLRTSARRNYFGDAVVVQAARVVYRR